MSTQFNLAIVVTAVDKGAAAMMKKTGSAARGMGKAGAGAGKQMGTLEGAMDKFKKSVLPAVGIVVGFGIAVKEAFEFAEEGAQIERLRASGAQLAADLGGNMDEILNKVRAASLGMVSDTEIIGAANRAMMLGLGANADQLANLMEVAAFRARAMGISTTQAFNDITTGIGRGSKLILDNLGIIVDTTAVYEDWAAAHGTVKDAMTDAQKTQALLNSVLMEGNAMIEAAGGLVLDTAGQYEVFNANIENNTNRLKEWAAGIGENVVTSLNGLMEVLGIGGALDIAFTQQAERVAESSRTFEEYQAAIIQAATRSGQMTDFTKGYIDAQGRLVERHQDVLGQTYELVDATGLLSREQFKATKVQEDWTQAIGFEAPAAVSQYVDAARDGVRANRELATSSQGVIWSMDELKTLMAGPVGEENERFAEQQADIQEEMEEVAAQIRKLQMEQGLYAASTEEITVAQYKASQAADRLTTAQQQLAENTDPEKHAELEAAVAGAQIAFDKASGAAANASGVFVDNSEKIGGLQGKYADLQGSLDEAAATHRERMNSIIFDLVMAELAVGGFTEAEAELASRFAQDMGLIDESTATAMQGVASAMAGFAQSEGVETALWRLGQVRDAALAIPNEIPIAVRVQGGAALAQSITGGFGPPAGVTGAPTGPIQYGAKAQTTTTVGGATTINFNISDPASMALAMKQAEDMANAAATAGYGGG